MQNLLRIFDNIAFTFSLSGDCIKPISPLQNYKLLDSSHIGYNIPYIARNSTAKSYETGIGTVFIKDGIIQVKKIKILSSSNNNTSVQFENANNEFFVFANQEFFDKAITNVMIINSDTSLDPISALYLIECENNLNIKLPDVEKCNNTILDFKIINPTNHSVTLRSSDDGVITTITNNDYKRFTVYNNRWIEVSGSSISSIKALSVKDSFTALSDPAGDNNSFQYKVDNTTFAGSDIYWHTTSGLLFGSDSAGAAKNIIPYTGNNSTLFNLSNDASDFIVYGSGNPNRNFFFAYDGRIGLNIPTGLRPLTLVHIINTGCQQGIRLENRVSCVPANITLYHKPATDVVSDTVISQIHLNSKNSEGNETYYSRLQAKATEVAAGNEKGGLEIIVVSGSSYIKTINTNTDSTSIGYNNQKLNISNNSNILLYNTNAGLRISSTGVAISGSTISLNAAAILTTGVISAKLQSEQIKLTNISPNSILTIDSEGIISAASSSVNDNGSIQLSIADNKLLTTTNNGNITGIYNIDDYFLTNKDISWNFYPKETGTICTRDITFTSPVNTNEFSVGDQVVIDVSGTNYYRTVDELSLNNNQIIGIRINEILSIGGTNDVQVYSITKGGYLELSKYVDDGITSDATSHILSIRPNLNTTFNVNKKNTNFEIYGLNSDPAFSVNASGSTVGINTIDAYVVPSGRIIITEQATSNPANLTVDGWLYAKNMMVGEIGSSSSALISPSFIETSGLKAKTVQYVNLQQIDISGNVLSVNNGPLYVTSGINNTQTIQSYSNIEYSPTQINNKTLSLFSSGLRAYSQSGNPALYVYPKINNSVSGSAYSGVFFNTFLDRAKSTASGWSYDTNAKVTINTDTPYIISSLATGTYLVDSILVTGYGYLYSDLTVNGLTYSSEIVTNDIYLKPSPTSNNTGKYIANALLTIDRNGKIISKIPTENYTVPGAPQNLSSTQGNGIGNGEISLIWTSPSNNGGTPILSYIIEFSLDDGGTWTRLPVGNYTLNRASSNSTHCSILGLSPINDYRFRVAAQNNIGIGIFSSNSDTLTPESSAPKAPNNLAYSRSYNENNTSDISLSWLASDAGGASIIGYTIQESTDKGLTWQDYNNTSNFITGTSEVVYATNSSLDYYYRISAWNDYNSLNNQSSFAYIYVSGTNPGAPFDTIDNSLSNWDFGVVLFTGVC